MKPLAQNTMIQGRYLIVQLIGKGGMGEVYLAVDQRLGSAVALKRTYFAGDETLGSAFEREARILARMRHPVLPKVSDHFGEGDEQYLVMEHISGDDLSKRLEVAQKPFPLSWVMFWADQLLDALSYLHSHEPPIIHRDIKPQNLKLTDENHIILLDFGLSKSSTGNTLITDSGGTSGSTTGGSTASVVGYTPHYAPMEQIRGIGTNPRSDLYSLSATLYQLLSNTVPTDALTRADDIINVGSDPIRPLHEVGPEVPVSVSNVIMKAMELSQEKRYGTAKEMQKELRRGYASMQNAMSAQTVAFTTDVIEVEPEPESSVNMDKTEVMNFGTLDTSSPQPLAADPVPTYETPAVQDFDATVAFSNDAGNSEPRQADVKTEVFIPGSFNVSSEPEPALEPDVYVEPETPSVENEAASPAWDATFAASGFEDQAESGQSFSPEATVPLMGFDQGTASNDDQDFQQSSASDDLFTSPGGFEQTSDSTPVFDSAPNEQGSHSVAAAATSSAATVAAPAKQKKKGSAGKIVGIFAGLLALFLLLGGGIGGSWYYYTYHYLPGQMPVSEESPTPTPFESPSPEPTISSGIDDSNSNSEDGSNSNSDTNINTNTGVESSPTPTATPTPIAGVTPRQEPTPRRETTPRPTPRTTPRQTPAPTPRRTPQGPVILQ
ncbi:MAG: serine/threonine protein kinase [Acidobacteria bacterium]|nr:serine/threonine protein kinase [Acidobacteriota bacterium]